MKIDDLKFEPRGCCGEYLNATHAFEDGRLAVITDNRDGTYTVAITRDGVLTQPLLRNIDVVAVEQLLT